MSMYLVKTLKTEITIEVMGFERELKLSWSAGMVGVIPVFKDKESALAFANGDENLVTELNYR